MVFPAGEEGEPVRLTHRSGAGELANCCGSISRGAPHTASEGSDQLGVVGRVVAAAASLVAHTHTQSRSAAGVVAGVSSSRSSWPAWFSDGMATFHITLRPEVLLGLILALAS